MIRRMISSILLVFGFPHLVNSWTSTHPNRREILISGSIGGFTLKNPYDAVAATDNVPPVSILGANGRTGSLCVAACLKRGIPVRALTRTGVWVPPTEGLTEGITEDVKKLLLSVSSCDVKDPQALYEGIKGSQSVIYAASASKQGGNAKEIDNDAVVAAGEVSRSAKVPRYVVLSSTATTRPKSLGYIFTNMSVGGIMDEKRKGEQRISDLYNKDAGGNTSCSYTIIRPGGLEEPKQNKVLGPQALEISQGDTLAGIISRADLAEFTVEIALSEAQNIRNTALEIYYTNSAQPCEGRFKPFLTNGLVPRIHGESYQEIIRQIQPNIDFYQ